MIKEIKLPEVSDNVETGDVLKVLVKVGDKVEIDQPLVELETEKATFEVPSTESGVVKEINVKEGDTIKIGALMLTLESNGNGEKITGKSENRESEVKDKDSEEKGSDKGLKTDSTDKDKSEKGDKEEDKSEKEEKSDEKDKSKNEENGEVKTEEKDEKKDEKSNGKDLQKIDEKKDTENLKPILSAASPSVRRLARELGVDINSVPSADSSDRITEEDIKHYVKEKLSSDAPSGIPVIQKSLPDFKQWGEIEIESMSKIRTITAESMTYAWTTIPMVTQFDKADISHLEEFRKKSLKKIEEAGGHLTITSILVKVCEAALRSFPQFNSSIDLQKKEIIYKKYYNIGVAVDTGRGLLVPVIKDADKKNIKEISKELNELAEKARNKKITPAEMEGGNFTISNLGGIGGTAFSPIVYPPQVAILGVSRGNIEGVFKDGKFEPRLILPLALTYDHRIIDGADAARFLRWICEALENPISMML
jgi:pyruvate dehydrogenase E2 component (dihydrolipoamide acetyltransferase)